MIDMPIQTNTIGPCAMSWDVTAPLVPGACATNITSAGGVTEMRVSPRRNNDGNLKSVGPRGQGMSAGPGEGRLIKHTAMGFSVDLKPIESFMKFFEEKFRKATSLTIFAVTRYASIHGILMQRLMASILHGDLFRMLSGLFAVKDSMTLRPQKLGTSTFMVLVPVWSAKGTMTVEEMLDAEDGMPRRWNKW